MFTRGCAAPGLGSSDRGSRVGARFTNRWSAGPSTLRGPQCRREHVERQQAQLRPERSRGLGAQAPAGAQKKTSVTSRNDGMRTAADQAM